MRQTAAIGVLTLGLMLGASSAQAQTATFSAVKDAVPGRNFDATTTFADGNHLIVGFNVGQDPVTWRATEFQASGLAFNVPATSDTLAFTVTAPAGYYVSRVTYAQRGSADVSRTGRSFASTQLVVNGVPSRLGNEGPIVSGTVATSGKPQSVGVSIAVALVSAGATVRVTGADVFVELLPR